MIRISIYFPVYRTAHERRKILLMVSCNSPMNGFKQVVFQALSLMFGCTNLAILLLTSQHSAINGTNHAHGGTAIAATAAMYSLVCLQCCTVLTGRQCRFPGASLNLLGLVRPKAQQLQLNIQSATSHYLASCKNRPSRYGCQPT